MQINKKILLLAISISLHGAIMSMEEANTEKKVRKVHRSEDEKIQRACRRVNKAMKQATGQVEAQTQHALNFIDNPEENLPEMVLLGVWLTQQRNRFPDQQYEILVGGLTRSFGNKICRCICLKRDKMTALQHVIEDTANRLKPGNDCSQLLADGAKEALKELVENK